MLYDNLKILHILSATVLLTSVIYCVRAWFVANNAHKVFLQTGVIIFPAAIIQLVSGFTMISLRQYDLSAYWITGSISGFILLILSWFAFLYLQLATFKFQRQLQIAILTIFSMTLLFMIFLMTNQPS